MSFWLFDREYRREQKRARDSSEISSKNSGQSPFNVPASS
jgi:hypothetical protein